MRTNSLLLGVALILVSNAIYADDNLKKGLAKAQYMLRQVTAEKTDLQKKLDLEKKKVAEIQEELDSKRKNADRKVGNLENNLDTWKQEYKSLEAKYREMQIKYAELQKLSQFQADQFAAQTTNFDICEKQNAKLVEVSQSLLSAYQNKSVGDALKQNDPFLGLKKVEIENLVQEYNYKIEDLDLRQTMHVLQDLSIVE